MSTMTTIQLVQQLKRLDRIPGRTAAFLAEQIELELRLRVVRALESLK